MQPQDLAKFRKLFIEQRQVLLGNQDRLGWNEGSNLVLSKEALFDEGDLCAAETEQRVQLRLRDRERNLLKKIHEALDRMNKGEFGLCSDCGDTIDVRRLQARPVTTLCIQCKEEQERKESTFAQLA